MMKIKVVVRVPIIDFLTFTPEVCGKSLHYSHFWHLKYRHYYLG